MNSVTCYLDNINLDLVTEADHAHNYCYCSKCSCGKHICPKPSSKPYPKSTFSSYYKINYKRHSISQRPVLSSKFHKRSQFKLENETTNGRDFKQWEVEKSLPVAPQQASLSSSKYRLSSNSTYKQNFTNWGYMKAEIIKQVSIPASSGIRFNATTTYSNFCSSTPGKPSQKVSPHVNTNILCIGVTNASQSTAKVDYCKPVPMPTGQIVRGDSTVVVPSHPFQYSTVNSILFDSKEPTNGIRRARRSLD